MNKYYFTQIQARTAKLFSKPFREKSLEGFSNGMNILFSELKKAKSFLDNNNFWVHSNLLALLKTDFANIAGKQ